MAESLRKGSEILYAQSKKIQKRPEQRAIMVKQLQEIIFGKKTGILEWIADGQLSLFDLANDLNLDQEIAEVVKATTIKVVRHRPAEKQLARQEFLDQPPQVEEVISLKTVTCPNCQHRMVRIGKRLVRRETRPREPKLYCANLYKGSYRCKRCNQDGNDKLVTSKHQ